MKSRITLSTLSAVLVMASLTACQGGATGTAHSAASGVSVDTAAGVPVGSSCSGKGSLCLGIHFVAYQDPSGKPVATQAQAATILQTMNTLWNQCGIQFQIDKYEQVNPADYNLDYGSAAQNQLDTIRSTFGYGTEMLAVTTGPWGAVKNAWTNMPGDGTYGAIMEASIVDYGAGIIYAHEFGHYLGLDHVSDTADLMDAIIYTNSDTLTAGQCATAKATAQSYWAAMLR